MAILKQYKEFLLEYQVLCDKHNLSLEDAGSYEIEGLQVMDEPADAQELELILIRSLTLEQKQEHFNGN